MKRTRSAAETLRVAANMGVLIRSDACLCYPHLRGDISDRETGWSLSLTCMKSLKVVIRYRSTWFQLYRERKLSLDGLREIAPLIAVAVEEDLAQEKDWRI